MRILADCTLPRVEALFSRLGTVRLFTPPVPPAASLRDADVLLVRSVTRVDADLLADSQVRFVATATSGYDHLDTVWLERAGIVWSAAGGCNARAVAEYVLAALCFLAERDGHALGGRSVGVVGCGHVGSCVLDVLEALGMHCLPNDPPLEEAGVAPPGGRPWRRLDEALQADVVTLHVPLHRTGRHATRHLLDAARLDCLKPGAILINTARGEVVDEVALTRRLAFDDLTAAADVWTGEPAIDVELARRVRIGTAHIAGYSRAARHRAVRTIYERTRSWLGLPPEAPPVPSPEATPPVVPARRQPLARPPSPASDVERQLRRAVLEAYDIGADVAHLKATLDLSASQRARAFDALRSGYPLRREFSEIRAPDEDTPAWRALGFAPPDSGSSHASVSATRFDFD